MEFVFIIKFISNPLKNDIIVGDIFGVLFQVQMIWHKLFWEAKRNLKVFLTIFFLFSNRKQGNKYVQNIVFAPFNDRYYNC